MKNYTITVNGNVYEVTVEEGTGAAAPQQLQHQQLLRQHRRRLQGSSTGWRSRRAVKISAPMPGKILGVKATRWRQL